MGTASQVFKFFFVLISVVLGFAFGICTLTLLGSIEGASTDMTISDIWAPFVFCIVWLLLVTIGGGILAAKAWSTDQLVGLKLRTVRLSRRAGIATIISFPILFGGACIGAAKIVGALPSDASMIRNFYRNRSTFGGLATINWPKGDNGDWISASGSGPLGEDCTHQPCKLIPSPFTSSQVSSTSGLLRQVGAGLVSKDDYGGIQIAYKNDSSPTFDLDSGTSQKGYVYMNKPPVKLESILDRYDNIRGDKNLTVYRHITGNWYLYYQHEPTTWS